MVAWSHLVMSTGRLNTNMRKKSDSQLLAEAYEGSVSQGGPLGNTSTPSTANSTTTEQGEEEAEGLMGLVARLLQGVEDGSIDEGEACEHVKMVLSGEVEESEHESKEEQEKENEGDYSGHEDAEDVDGDPYEDEENKKRNTVQQATDAMRAQFGKGKGNTKRPQPDRNVQGVKRNTSQYQQGM